MTLTSSLLGNPYIRTITAIGSAAVVTVGIRSRFASDTIVL